MANQGSRGVCGAAAVVAGVRRSAHMPLAYHVGALLDELARLRLFVVEIRGFDAMLVPAVSAGAKAEPEARTKAITLGAKIPEDHAAQFRAAAGRNGTNASALIAQFIADYVVANV